MSSTDEVFISPKLTLFNFAQLENIFCIVLTLEVSNKDISIDTILEQFPNK